MLADRFDAAFLKKHFTDRTDWCPFPPAADRAAWDDLLKHPLNRERRAYAVGRAEVLLGKPWPDLPATVFMENTRDGNRTHWEAHYFARRWNLSILVMAECLEYKGRFIDEIINGMWLITEEATWALNAHAYKAPLPDGTQDPLPDQEHETLALFSIQTAAILMEADYLLAEAIGRVSQAVRTRVHNEVERRIIATFESIGDDDLYTDGGRPKFWWLSGRNNWTPWCCTNLLSAAMYLLNDPARLVKIAVRCLTACDRFIGNYQPDGGCDEGPSYWFVAGGALLRFLELLHSRTEGALDIYSEPLIREMGLYITRVNLDGTWFANFADAPAKITANRGITYRFGERVKAPAMQGLVLSQMKAADGTVYPPLQTGFAPLMYLLRELWWMPAELPDIPCIPEPQVWLPDLQVMVSRAGTAPASGIVLAAKAGHNAENHNHNDIGQFILLNNGQPAVVDPGTEAYTRFTFSPQRYTLWTHRSLGHNVPCVNGWEQAAGEEYKAADVVFAPGDTSRTLRMDLAPAYPAEAGIRSLKRTIAHDLKASTVTVTDQVKMDKGPVTLMVPLFVPRQPVRNDDGSVTLGTMRLTCKPADATIAFSVQPINDKNLSPVWGKELHRIEITVKGSGNTAEMTLRFAAD